MKTRIALAEDNHFLAKSIQERLVLYSDELSFQFRASDGQDLLRKLEDSHALDVLLMDIEMPHMDGIQATAEVSTRYPHIKIIMLTVFDDEKRIIDAIQAGASGYLLKDEPPARLLESIHMIRDGGAPMSPAIAARALALLREPFRTPNPASREEFGLTGRELQVLEQLSEGLEYQQIAANLFISPATVRKHIENTYRKLQVNNKMRAVSKATRHGLI